MKAIDIANFMIKKFGNDVQLTNLRINKLLYYAQVEQLRHNGTCLFSDAIEAWTYGPVVPAVYQVFKRYQRDDIAEPSSDVVTPSDDVVHLLERVVMTYGKLSTFDLVEFSHRPGGAWKKVYEDNPGGIIHTEDILLSDDMNGFNSLGRTIEEDLHDVIKSIPNALRLLANS